MGFLRRGLIGILLWVVALTTLGYGISRFTGDDGENESRTVRERRLSVSTVNPINETITPKFNTSGTIVTSTTYTIRAPLSGTISDRHPNFIIGGTIQKGDTLLRVEPFNPTQAGQSARRAAQQALNAALTRLRNAESALERQHLLHTKGIVSALSVDEAENAVASAQEDVSNRRIALTPATIKAPFSGVIESAEAEIGEMTNANEVLGVLYDPNALEVEFNLSNDELDRMRTLANPLKFTATISADSPSSNALEITSDSTRTRVANSGTSTFYAPLGAQSDFKEGDYVDIDINLPPINNALTITLAAITNDDSVWVIGEDSRIHKTSINVIHRLSDRAIVQGIERNATLVAQNSPAFADGILVETSNRDLSAERDNPSDHLTLSDDQIERIKAWLVANDTLPSDRVQAIAATLESRAMPRAMYERLRPLIEGI